MHDAYRILACPFNTADKLPGLNVPPDGNLALAHSSQVMDFVKQSQAIDPEKRGLGKKPLYPPSTEATSEAWEGWRAFCGGRRCC